MEIAQTADHALRILMSIGDDGPASLAELSERLDLSRSATQRLVATLRHRGFVEQGSGSRYSIGTTVVDLSRLSRASLVSVAHHHMKGLATVINETVVLSIRAGTYAVVKRVATSDVHLLRVDFPVDFRYPITSGSGGRAILINSTQPIRKLALSHAADPEQARRALDEAIRDGYAVSHNEVREGVYGLGMPLKVEGYEASLTVVAPSNRSQQMLSLLPSLAETVASVEQDLAAQRAS